MNAGGTGGGCELENQGRGGDERWRRGLRRRNVELHSGLIPLGIGRHGVDRQHERGERLVPDADEEEPIARAELARGAFDQDRIDGSGLDSRDLRVGQGRRRALADRE